MMNPCVLGAVGRPNSANPVTLVTRTSSCINKPAGLMSPTSTENDLIRGRTPAVNLLFVVAAASLRHGGLAV